MSGLPYVAGLGERDPQAVIAETPARLANALEGLSAEQIEAQPAPGKWSLREIAAHLADCEIAWSWRLRYVYGAKDPVLQPFDQDAWARIYSTYSYADARAAFVAMRAWNVAFVAGLTEADKQKTYRHPERGEETLWNIVEIMAGHDLHHLKSLEERGSRG